MALPMSREKAWRIRWPSQAMVKGFSSGLTISTTPQVSQPNALGRGETVVTEKSDIAISQQGGALIQMPAGAKLADVVKALNALGATPQDLLAILQAMKSAGALNADIDVI